MNVISRAGILELIEGKSKDVRQEILAWYRVAKAAAWSRFADVQKTFVDADLVDELLVFNIRGNRYRLIVYPVFARRKLYIKALLSHAEYDRMDWKRKWP